jgi:hypothetical protein
VSAVPAELNSEQTIRQIGLDRALRMNEDTRYEEASDVDIVKSADLFAKFIQSGELPEEES